MDRLGEIEIETPSGCHEPGRREESKAHHMLGWLLHECPSTHSRPDASTPTQCTARPLGAASKILNDKARRSSQQSRRSNRRSAVATGPAEGRRGLAAPDPLARPTTAARPRGPAPHHRVLAEYPDKSPEHGNDSGSVSIEAGVKFTTSSVPMYGYQRGPSYF